MWMGIKMKALTLSSGLPFFLLLLLSLIVARQRRSANLCCGIIYPHDNTASCECVSEFFRSFRFSLFHSIYTHSPNLLLIHAREVTCDDLAGGEACNDVEYKIKREWVKSSNEVLIWFLWSSFVGLLPRKVMEYEWRCWLLSSLREHDALLFFP